MSKPPQDIKERAFEFALLIIKLYQHLDKKPAFLEPLAINCLRLELQWGLTLKRLKQARADQILSARILSR
jgi:hypothetical protein